MWVEQDVGGVEHMGGVVREREEEGWSVEREGDEG